MLAALPENPQNSTDNPAPGGLRDLLLTAAFARLPSTSFIRVSGEDRVRWLNGMVTNSVVALTAGQGCYAFFLNAQGRIQGDAIIWRLDDTILLEVASDLQESLSNMLNRFIIMDDVELEPLEDLPGLLIAGPHAASALAAIGLLSPSSAELAFKEASFEGSAIRVMKMHSPLVPRYELWGSPTTIDKVFEALGGSTPEASQEDLEQLRILEGTPLYGTDIRDRELPQETGQTRALHFSKGCYLGQEIVERIRSRGNVHRTFSGFRLTGKTPTPGTALFETDAPDKPLGEITSVTVVDLPSGPAVFAIGYIRREALDRAPKIRYDGGVAEPSTLPFPLTFE